MAPRGHGSAQLLDTATASVLFESESLGALQCCEVFERHGLLLSAGHLKVLKGLKGSQADGLLRLWDLRSPSLVKVATVGGSALLTVNDPRLKVLI